MTEYYQLDLKKKPVISAGFLIARDAGTGRSVMRIYRYLHRDIRKQLFYSLLELLSLNVDKLSLPLSLCIADIS